MAKKTLFAFLLIGLLLPQFSSAKYIKWQVSAENYVKYAQNSELISKDPSNLVERTPISEKFLNSDGSYTLNVYPEQQFYYSDGKDGVLKGWWLLSYATTTPENWLNINPAVKSSGFLINSAFADTASTSVITVDGEVGRRIVNENWATIRAGAGAYAVDSAEYDGLRIRESGTPNQFDILHRVIIGTDTTGLIPDGATLESASLFLKSHQLLDEMGIKPGVVVATTSVSGGNLVNSDYDIANYGVVPLGSAIWSDFTTDSYTEIPLNSTALSWIDNTTTTYWGILFDFDFNDVDIGSAGGGATDAIEFYFSETAGITSDPYLSITYTPTASATSTATSTALTSGDILNIQIYFILEFLFFALCLWLVFKGLDVLFG